MALNVKGELPPPVQPIAVPVQEKLPPIVVPKSTLPPGSQLAAVLKAIRKETGDASVITGNQVPQVQRLPTGLFEFDLATGGGFPRGRYSIIYGPESCIDEDSFIQYEVRKVDGSRQSHKGGSIKRLWHRFHGKKMPGKGSYQRQVTQYSEFYAPSINEEGRVFQNLITDVVDTGFKECYRVTTDSGLQLIATLDEKFFIGTGYVPLSALAVGTEIQVHKNVPFTVENQKTSWRPEYTVKHHPYGREKIVDGKYVYKRLTKTRAVLEAYNSGLSMDSYLDRLNSGNLEGLVFVPPSVHVHHKDENFLNDAIDNLELMAPSEHGRLHAYERHNNLRYRCVPEKIASIECVGVRHTYDLRMLSPYNNYVTEGFVVHNSGKSNICYAAAAQAQKLPPPCNKVVWVDLEGTFDAVWAEQFGIDVGELYVAKPAYGEQAVDFMQAFAQADDVALLVLDSLAVVVSSKEIAQTVEKFDVGTAPMLVKRMCNKLVIALTEQAKKGHYPAIVLVNQTRFKIGVMFGDPETMPGGQTMKFLSSLTVRLFGKNKIVKEVNPDLSAFKETHAVIKKAKVPVTRMVFDYDMCMLEQEGLRVGESASWSVVANHLKQLNVLQKVETSAGGWRLFGVTYPKLTFIQTKYQTDKAFSIRCQAVVVDSFKDKMFLTADEEKPDKIDPALIDMTTGEIKTVADE